MSESLEGVYDPLTPEQAAKVAELRERIEGIPRPPGFTRMLEDHPTLFLLKWLFARKWVVEDALTMYKDCCEWRIEQGFDTKPLFPNSVWVRGYDMDKLKEIHGTGQRDTDQFADKAAARLKTVYAGGWHKWDKDGRPVYYERTGHVKTRQLVERCREMMPPGESLDPVVVEPHKLSNETGNVLLRAQNEKLKAEGKYVAQATVVLDCTGLSMSHFYSPALDLLKANSTMDQKYGPEGMYKCYVVNAPTFIKIGWNMIRLWIDARSQAKVVFVSPGEPTRQALLNAINEEDLPDFLGGTCKCEGGCIPDVEENAESLGGDATLELTVPARGAKTHVEACPKGAEVSWQWSSANGNDCGFHVFFKNVDEAELDTVAATETNTAAMGHEVVPSSRQTSGKGSFTAPQDGYVTLRFDNTFSWMKGKTVHLRVSTAAASS
uniref:CRAL-TRIO domain-containing protein n=1 Tax=Neobodo designis TaxID=312471 RepID=A0A7S1Q779_NEODS|mmetsp:Transcript_3511/g.10900  ORF Transcript_3511/g.10900 Transcript_3511/m.10900 type:complete len:436 (+) Transcript_3511:34-1341(+)